MWNSVHKVFLVGWSYILQVFWKTFGNQNYSGYAYCCHRIMNIRHLVSHEQRISIVLNHTIPQTINNSILTPSFEVSYPSISEERFKNKYPLSNIHVLYIWFYRFNEHCQMCLWRKWQFTTQKPSHRHFISFVWIITISQYLIWWATFFPVCFASKCS